jgi:mRNA-degrading endonuclease RelE of RelBE toxin-antitoxin system
MFEFYETPKFRKDFNKLDSLAKKTTIKKLQSLQISENPLYHARKIYGLKDTFRFRIENLRLIFEINKNRITLLAIKHRKEVYKNIYFI